MKKTAYIIVLFMLCMRLLAQHDMVFTPQWTAQQITQP